MKFKLKNTPDQIELIKAMGSNDKQTSIEAQTALAAFMGPVVQTVLNQAGFCSMIYEDHPFDENSSPEYPVDLFFDQNVDYISTWSQSYAGGLGTNTISGNQTMKVSTYRLDTAISYLKKYAKQSRLDVVAKGMNRMAQEMLVKQELNGWVILLRALAKASTAVNSTATQHVFRSATAGVFTVQDLSDLKLRSKRINVSFSQGTPEAPFSSGATDLFISPEIMGQIRGFAYQPVNTKAGVLSGTSSAGYTASVVTLPDAVREKIFNAAGATEIYGLGLHELNELGQGQRYNQLFASVSDGSSYKQIDNSSGSATFAAGSTEIVIGLDLSRDVFIRPVSTSSDSGGVFQIFSDDQFYTRSEKVGFYGFLEEGRLVLDSRPLSGLIV